MRVVVVGAGQVGFNVARMLSGEGHDVVVIEQNQKLVDDATEQLDALVLQGNGASPKLLEEAGIKKSQLLVAATDRDEVNITACLAAKHFGVPRTAARIHNPDYMPQEPFAKKTLGIDYVIHTEQVAAEEIKAAILTPGAINVDSFAGGHIEVAEVVLQEDSPAVGRAVRDVNLPERTLILGGIRGGEPLMSRGDTVLEAKDHIFLISESQSITQAVQAVVTHAEPVTDVTILGGGRIGLRLAEALQETEVSIKVIEKDPSRAKYVASGLGKGVVVHEEDISRESLAREGVGEADAFVAVTSDDRTNLLGSMYAKQLGASLTIAGMGRGEYAPLSDALGVDITISPRLLAASSISRFVRRGDVVAVSLLESGAQMIELRVSKDSPVSSHPTLGAELPETGHRRHGLAGRRDHHPLRQGHARAWRRRGHLYRGRHTRAGRESFFGRVGPLT